MRVSHPLRPVLLLFAASACGRSGLGEIVYEDGAIPSDASASRVLDAHVETDGPKAVQVASGCFHSCALLENGSVKCWGDNQFGQLGDGTTTTRSIPVDVVDLGGVATSVSAGGENTCALLSTGSVRCWGRNEVGSIGDGTNVERHTPTDVIGLSGKVTAISDGVGHTCALLASGEVQCWGYNGYGGVGDGTLIDRASPVNVVSLGGPASSISAGGGYSCAVLASGVVRCWGTNAFGELGDGTISTRAAPVDTVSSSSIAGVSAGAYHTCMVTASGGVRCWGYNWAGDVGDGTTGSHQIPVDVVSMAGPATAVSAGQSPHSCALLTSGAVECWGNNAKGELGVGTTTSSSVPMNVAALGGIATNISTGVYFTCARLTSGVVRCWGVNDVGQLGDGTLVGSLSPVTVSLR